MGAFRARAAGSFAVALATACGSGFNAGDGTQTATTATGSGGATSSSAVNAASSGTGGGAPDCAGQTGCVEEFAGKYAKQGNADGTGTAATFTAISGITGDDADAIYVAANHAVRKIVISTGVVTTIAGHSGLDGDTNDTGGPDARFGQLAGISYVGFANMPFLLVADASKHRLKKVDLGAGYKVTYFAGDGNNGVVDNGDPTKVEFGALGDVATAPGECRMFIGDGKAIRVAFCGGSTVTINPLTLMGALGTPSAIAAFDDTANGNTMVLTVAEADGSDVAVYADPGFPAAAWTTKKLCGTSAGYLEGACASAKFSAPKGIARRGAGDAVVADTDNNRLRLLQVAKGATVAIAGDGTPGHRVGIGVAAKLDHPAQLYLRPMGDAGGRVLFIVDANGTEIRKMAL